MIIDNGELDNYKKVLTVTPIEDQEILFLLSWEIGGKRLRFAKLRSSRSVPEGTETSPSKDRFFPLS
uniref:hypothetical protein n=1 Tax=Okeania sp. SIO2F4 TaxID=2607790 RepID=UPI0025CFF868